MTDLQPQSRLGYHCLSQKELNRETSHKDQRNDVWKKQDDTFDLGTNGRRVRD